MTPIRPPELKVADEVWIGAALLHREQPDAIDFAVGEILARIDRENITGRLRPGVYVSIVQHCVANRPPSPARYRMLYATARDRRRLFRPGDPFDPRRDGSKTIPDRLALPLRYGDLVDWYHEAHSGRSARAPAGPDPLLAARGIGRAPGAAEHPDDRVRRLRDSWA